MGVGKEEKEVGKEEIPEMMIEEGKEEIQEMRIEAEEMEGEEMEVGKEEIQIEEKKEIRIKIMIIEMIGKGEKRMTTIMLFQIVVKNENWMVMIINILNMNINPNQRRKWQESMDCIILKKVVKVLLNQLLNWI